jgi:hypothetical protein
VATGLERPGERIEESESAATPRRAARRRGGPVAARGPAAAEYHPSAEDIRREIGLAMEVQLSPDLLRWVERYARVGRRNLYLWKWCRRGVAVTTLPCVPADLRDEVCDIKVLGVMLDVLLDDVADQGGDDELLERMLALPSGGAAADVSRFAPEQRAYARLTAQVWGEIQARARRLPCHGAYAALLRYDYAQLANAMRYSHLLNRDLDLLNPAEHDVYLPHNMHMMISSTLDLMCSPGFDRAELGRVREAAWHGQCMGRIGNLVTTWERELGEGDFTSGVYARAVACGDLSVPQLREGDRERVRGAIRDGRHEAYFLGRWQEHRRHLLALASRVRSFDLNELVAGLQRLICLHLGSRGYK